MSTSQLKAGNVTEVILAHLKTEGSITPMKAIVLYSCMRLSDVIFRLRKRGHDIETVDRTDARGRPFGEYQYNSTENI